MQQWPKGIHTDMLRAGERYCRPKKPIQKQPPPAASSQGAACCLHYEEALTHHLLSAAYASARRLRLACRSSSGRRTQKPPRWTPGRGCRLGGCGCPRRSTRHASGKRCGACCGAKTNYWAMINKGLERVILDGHKDEHMYFPHTWVLASTT
jgi:hypothetical protein